MLTQKDLAEAIEKAGLSRESSDGRVSLQLKAATDPIVSPTGPSFVDTSVAVPSQWTQVLRGLMPTIPVSGAGSVTHYRMSASGTPSLVDEGGQKPQFSTEILGEVLPLAVVAGIEKVSDEAIDDVPQLIRTAEQLARAEKDKLALREIFVGTGDISGMLRNTAIPAVSGGAYVAITMQRLMMAITGILSDGYSPNAIATFGNALSNALSRYAASYEMTVGTNSQNPQATAASEMGSPFVAPIWSYERAFGAVRPHFAGIPIIIIPGIVPPGLTQQVLVGDFASGAALYSAGERLDLGHDDDDFSHDRYSLRISERMNVAVRDPNAFRRVAITTV